MSEENRNFRRSSREILSGTFVMAPSDLHKTVTCFCEWKVSGIGLACGNSANWINGHIVLTNELSGHHWYWFIKLFHKVKPESERHKIKLQSGAINKLIETKNNPRGLTICLEKSGTNVRLTRPQSQAAYKELYSRLEILRVNFPSPIPPTLAAKRSAPTPSSKLRSTVSNSNNENAEPKRSIISNDGSVSKATPKRKIQVAEISPLCGDSGVDTNNQLKEQCSSSVPSKKTYIMSALKKSTDSLETKSAPGFYKSTSSSWGHNLIGSSRSVTTMSRKPGLLHCSKSVDYSWAKLKATSPFKDQSSSNKLQGFSNLGNTCYMNAILQSLFGLQSFSGDLLRSTKVLDKHSSHFQNKGNLLRALSRLLRANENSVSSDQKASLLHIIKRAISTSAKRFLGHEQHDAHEFLCQILDQLKEEIISLNKEFNEVRQMEENSAAPPSEASKLGNPTIENFECEVRHSITCLECDEVLTKCETFNDLSLELPRQNDMFDEKTIQDALNQFFCLEKIEYKCEKCSSNRASVKHDLVKLPRVLIIHLKRYAFNTARSMQGKLGRSIRIPRFLTLSHLCGDVKSPSIPSPMPKLSKLPESPKSTLSSTLSDQENDPLLIESPKQRFAFKRLSKSPIFVEDKSDSPVPAKKNRPDIFSKKFRVNRPLVFPEGSPSIRETMARPPSFSEFRLECSEEEQLRMALERSINDGNGQEEGINGQVDGIYDDQEMEKGLKFNAGSSPSVPLKTSTNAEGESEENIWSVSPIEASKDEEPPKWKEDNKEVPHYQDLNAAMEESRKQHETEEEKFQEELERVKEMSLMELYAPTLSNDFNDEEDCAQETVDLNINDSIQEKVNANCETGELPHSFQLISVVSHFGSTSVGHYISDVFNFHKNSWLSCDDSSVKTISESEVLSKRMRTGYIFFYVNKEISDSLAQESPKSSSRVLHSQGNSNQPLVR